MVADRATGYGNRMEEGVSSSRPKRKRSLPIGAVVAVALAAAFLVWLLVRDGDSNSSTSAVTTPVTTPPRVTTTSATPILEAASVQTLKTVPALVGHPVYWAGPKAGTTYELTRTSEDRIFIRYLPKGVKVGDRRASALIVATYPVPNAYRAVGLAAKEQGAQTFSVPGGGKAVVNKSAPKNIYFAFPRSNYQVEVFSPLSGRAKALVVSGKIRQLG
jgi:hypothetical protein